MATLSQRGRASPRSRAPHSSLRSAAGCRPACLGASRADLRTQHPQQPPGHRPHQTRRSRRSGTGSRPHRRLSRGSRALSSSWWGVERSEAGPAARSEVQAQGGVVGARSGDPPPASPSSEHRAVQVRGREPCSKTQIQACSPIPTTVPGPYKHRAWLLPSQGSRPHMDPFLLLTRSPSPQPDSTPSRSNLSGGGRLPEGPCSPTCAVAPGPGQ